MKTNKFIYAVLRQSFLSRCMNLKKKMEFMSNLII